MKNKEKYKNEIIQRTKNHVFLEKIIKEYVLPFYGIEKDVIISPAEAASLLILWLDEEYIEPKTDWSKVEVDTPILVRNSKGGDWEKRYFAKYENGEVFAWYRGATSWSDDCPIDWNFAKLAEVEDEE